MRLFEVVKLLEQHGVKLSLTPSGGLKPTADQQPPDELLAGIREHREAFIRRLERGQRADGRYYLADQVSREGVCASCLHWQQRNPGELWGRCPLLSGPPGIHAAHRCPIGRWSAARAEILVGRAA